ncbi:transport sec24-like [Babesia ovis]|uniref:Transport sec24-like n=1 Tax=Babesia ovis TaxID=5869 RepID=A0A9W5WUZ6_BABOV|nr:transport sec24-like [Babesia ovis]
MSPVDSKGGPPPPGDKDSEHRGPGRKLDYRKHHAFVHRKGVSTGGLSSIIVARSTSNSDVDLPIPSSSQNPPKDPPLSKVPSTGSDGTGPSSSDPSRRRRTISNGSDYNGSDIGYVDRELEKQIYSYGPYTPNKIDNRQVPRPVSNVNETDTESSSAATLVPSFSDTKPSESCSKRFLSLTLNEVPIYGDTLKRIKIPLAVVVQPFAEEVDVKVPVVDLVSAIGEPELSKQNLIRCPRCQVYFNPGMESDARLTYRICNFCYNGFTLTESESQALVSLKADVSKEAPVAPVMQGSVDFVAPARYYMPNPDDTKSITSQFSSLMSRANELSSKLPLIGSRFGSNDQVVYFTYGASDAGKAGLKSPADSKNHVATANGSTPFGTTGDQPSPLCANHTDSVATIATSLGLNTASLPVYVIAVDVTATSSAMDLRNCVISSLRSAFDVCAQKRTTVRFCVLAFDCVVYLFDRRDGIFNVNVVSEVSELFSPACAQELFLEFNGENINEVYEYLDKIASVSITPSGSLSCGNFALSVAIQLLADASLPGTVSIFYAQPPEVGLGHCPKPSLATDFSMEESMKIVYDGMIQQCYEHAIAVDVYICAVQERMAADIPLQYICQQTAGSCFYFSSFNAVANGSRIRNNFERLFTVPHGYKCELKLRTSRPVGIQGSYCPFHNMRSYIDKSSMRVPRLTPDTAICFHLSVDDLVSDKREIYIQLACMYSSSLTGQRLVRVHTQSSKVSTNIHSIFKSACCDTLVNFYARKLVYNMIRSGLNIKKKILDEVIAILACYRKLCAPSTPDNQLILPDNLKYLPCSLNSLFKIVNSGEQGIEFLQKMFRILLAPVPETMYIYSRCYCLHRSVYDSNETAPIGGWDFYCSPIPSSVTQVYSDGIYLIDDGQKLVLYFGPHVRWSLLQELFGQELMLDERTSNSVYIRNDTESGRNLLDAIDRVKGTHVGVRALDIKILPYASRHHRLIKLLLLEDESGGEMSYINFLVHLHKMIRQSLEDVIG